MLHFSASPAPPSLTFDLQPDPDAAQHLTARYGTLLSGAFFPAIPLEVRIKAAVALGVPEPEAVRDGLAALAKEERKLRSHGIDWQLLCVQITFGCGHGEIQGVDSSDVALLEEAQRQALRLAIEDEAAWARLGLSGS